MKNKISIPVFTTIATVALLVGWVSGAISAQNVVLLSFLGLIIHKVTKIMF